MKSNSIDHARPEKAVCARCVLLLLAAMGTLIAITEYRHDNLLLAMLGAGCTLLTPFVWYLGKAPKRRQLPEHAALVLLLLFLAIGGGSQLHQPEHMVLVVIMPLAFFLLSDLRTGLAISLFGLGWYLLSYLAYPLLREEARMDALTLAQMLGAYALTTALAAMYEYTRARHEAQLQEMANHDWLTGVPNRRGLLAFASIIKEQCHRSTQALGLILLDIDDIKRVNDTLGHDAGDVLLREVAELIRQQIRRSDVLARWSGAEFLLLLPNCDLDNAQRLTEKLRAAIASHNFLHGQNVTLSFGVTSSISEESWEEAVNRAERALHQAKSRGRNCAEALPAPLVPQAA